MKKSRIVINILLAIVAVSSMLLGGCSMSSNNYVGEADSYGERAQRKLGRGLTNIVTSPLEIPNQAMDLAAQSNEPAECTAGFLGGIFVGFAYGTGRIVSGMYDIVTSPFGGPDGPTMDPDLISSEFFDKVDERDDSFSDVTSLGNE